MAENIEAQILAMLGELQTQVGQVRADVAETREAVKGLARENEHVGKRLAKLELQVGGLLNREADRTTADRTKVEVRARDKGLLFAALSALAILAAVARDIVAFVRSAL